MYKQVIPALLLLATATAQAQPPLEIPAVESYHGRWTAESCSSESDPHLDKLPDFLIRPHANGKDLDIFYINATDGKLSSVFSTAGGTKVKENHHEGGQALITTSEATMIGDKIVVANIHKYTGYPSVFTDKETGQVSHAWLLAVDISSIKMRADGKFDYFRSGYSHEMWQQVSPEKSPAEERMGPYSVRCTFSRITRAE